MLWLFGDIAQIAQLTVDDAGRWCPASAELQRSLTRLISQRHVLGMPDRSSTRPRDPNQLAKLMVDIASGATTDPIPNELSKNPAAVALGRLGGAKGGKARAERLTPKERHDIAVRAAAARWEKNDR